ncbi:MAG: hypothetical protein ACO4AI_01080 [Prochlorothrix sp.]
MGFDYDLVVIGATAAAQAAVLRAVNLRARVAWVTQGERLGTDRANFPPPWDPRRPQPPIDLSGSLGLAGVDVLEGRGEFQPHPQVVLTVGDRVLRSRFYLLALQPVPILPSLATLDPATTFTPHTLSHHPPTALPAVWSILGSSPQTLAWAQWLQAQGAQVRLLLPVDRPQADYPQIDRQSPGHAPSWMGGSPVIPEEGAGQDGTRDRAKNAAVATHTAAARDRVTDRGRDRLFETPRSTDRALRILLPSEDADLNQEILAHLEGQGIVIQSIAARSSSFSDFSAANSSFGDSRFGDSSFADSSFAADRIPVADAPAGGDLAVDPSASNAVAMDRPPIDRSVGNRAVTDRSIPDRSAPQVPGDGEGFLGEAQKAWADLQLGLDRLGLSNTGPIAANRLGQTSHPQIYACGGLLGGYALPVLACHEATIAVDHALGQRPRPCRYATIPYVLPLDPPVLRVGLTPAQARYFHRRQLQISLISAPPDPRSGETAWAKLVVGRSGRIFGFHGCGGGLEGVLTVVAAAIDRRVPLGQLDRWAGDPFTSAILADWGQQWQQWRLRQDPGQERQLRWFFNRQRTGQV